MAALLSLSSASTTTTTTSTTNSTTTTSQAFPKPIPQNGERYHMPAETELRMEIPSGTSVTLTLLAGSAEIFGVELALANDFFTLDPAGKSTSSPPITTTTTTTTTSSTNTNMTTLTTLNTSTVACKQSYFLSGNTKLAIFTWHGCTIDVDIEFGKSLDIAYTSSETAANVAYVNTHAQLEVLRDEALQANLQLDTLNTLPSSAVSRAKDGPRVLIVGPPDSGKTSLAKILTAYAVKLGRCPILVDLDPSQNMLSIPGTISASPMSSESITVASHASSGTTLASSTTPLVFWYGSTEISSNPDLYQYQLTTLAQAIDARLAAVTANLPHGDIDARSSGIIINTSGWIEDVGYKLLLHAAQAFRVNVILVMGHDRLYSMLQTHFSKLNTSSTEDSSSIAMGTMTATRIPSTNVSPKVIKLPRSGGVVSRDPNFRRVSRSLCIKRYFHGDLIRSTASNSTTTLFVNQYTPVLMELLFAKIRLYRISIVTLSAAMLPVSAKQTTESVQLTQVSVMSPSLKHMILAVCHPTAVDDFDRSGNSSDLYLGGIAGFVAVERVNMEKELLSILSPCSGELPSNVLLMGEISWME